MNTNLILAFVYCACIVLLIGPLSEAWCKRRGIWFVAIFVAQLVLLYVAFYFINEAIH